jgi:hypothetical protein
MLPVAKPLAFLWTSLVVGPLLGSLITEPAAMTVTPGIHHFEWDALPSPQQVNAPIGATIRARDAANGLSGWMGGRLLGRRDNWFRGQRFRRFRRRKNLPILRRILPEWLYDGRRRFGQ